MHKIDTKLIWVQPLTQTLNKVLEMTEIQIAKSKNTPTCKESELCENEIGLPVMQSL